MIYKRYQNVYKTPFDRNILSKYTSSSKLLKVSNRTEVFTTSSAVIDIVSRKKLEL